MLVTGGARTGSKSVWAYNDDGTALWSYDTGGYVYDIAINTLGHVFIVGAAADNSDGNGTRNTWKLDAEGAYIIGAYVDSSANGFGIALDANYIYISHTAGADRFSHNLGSQTSILTSSGVINAVNVDTLGNIYLGGGGLALSLYKYNAALVQQWTEDTNDSFRDIDFLSDGSVIVGTSNQEVRKYLADGSSPSAGSWATTAPDDCHIAVDRSTDTIYAAGNNNGAAFYIIDSSGSITSTIDNSPYDVEDVVVTTAGAVYAVGDDNGDYSGWSVDLDTPALDNLIVDDSTTLEAIAWSPITITELTYKRNLIAICNNEVWYEISPGNMAELAAANGDFSTTKPLTATEAFQQIFIANGTNKKIIDFINTKLTTTDAGATVCTRGMVLTGGTSAATLRIDYVDAITDNSAMNVYGKRTSVATFVSGETVTEVGGSVSFVLSAAEVQPPHWYDWTVFGNDTTNYGTELVQPTLVCLYRGRIVTSGDSDYPQAWQMRAVGNPWKVLYDFAGDGDLSAVTYSNNLVGTIGDIVTALIPYKDDLLIFGCANSLWILIGDPLAQGSLAEITNATGIWGSRSWCIDNDRNLYFLGNDGVYKMPISETSTPPVNISKIKLPNLITDLDLDQELHRVVLTYDPVENGIIITRTLLDGGANTGYFLSLLTDGFFPESYPNSCGIFSAYYYSATDGTYKKFLVGCDDGYIREFDGSTKNDATTSSTTAISSYFTIVTQLGEDESREGMLRELRSIMAGGASGGDFGDSDGVSWELHTGHDAETVLEDIKDGATPFASGTWSTTGKQNKIRPRMRGSWMGLKIYNSTASQTWALERLFGDVIGKGRV